MEDAPAPVAYPPASGNGLAPLDTDVIVALRRRISERREALDDLQARASELTRELRRHEKALAILLDEPPTKKLGRPPGQKQVRNKPSNIGPERLELIERTIREFTQDREEFRQVDIRGITDIKSSVMATAFEQLRQANVIRFARQDGNNKYYRLTREALRSSDAPAT